MATVAKLQPHGDNLAVIFSDGSRVLAFKSLDYWNVRDNSNGLKTIERYNDLLKLNFNGGVKALAYWISGLWIVGPNPEPYTPPVFEWPFSLLSANVNNGHPEDGFHTVVRPTHNGYDFGFFGAVRDAFNGAAGAGTVVDSYNAYIAENDGSGSFGNFAVIDHGVLIDGFNYKTLYAHMKPATVSHIGAVLTLGQTVGVLASTGGSTGAHLHFEVHQNDIPIDPAIFMSIYNPTDLYVRP